MKILEGFVKWNEGWSNRPKLNLLVDEMPDINKMIYEQRGPLYYAEEDGYVNFFCYEKPGQGYAGREFHIKLKDGTQKVLKGPWSSNAMAMNEVGFGPCVEVKITDSKKVMELGYTFSSCAMTIKKILQFQDRIQIGKGYGIDNPIARGKSFKFPNGSKFHLYWEGCHFEPAVLLPNGEIWIKDEYLIPEFMKKGNIFK